MFENPACTKCLLHSSCSPRSVCLPGFGDINSPLAIYLDTPMMMDDRRHRPFVSESADFLRHCLKRMGIDPASIYLDYAVKCYPDKDMPGKKKERFDVIWECTEYRLATLQSMPNLKALVAMGGLACEVFVGSTTIGEKAGAEWEPREMWLAKLIPHVWVSYSPGYALQSPGEAGAITRVLWAAAEEAGLQPKVTKQPHYEWDL